MKYILSLILALTCFSVSATVPTEIIVFSSQVAGGKINVCRALLDHYATEYKTTVVFNMKPGADGMIAMEEMLKSKDFSILCTGPSEVVFNNTQYPGHEASHAALTMISVISVSPFSFITGINNKYSNLPDLLKSGKPITVGYHAQGLKFIAQTVFGDYPVTWVPYKQSTEALSSLVDGTLDVYTDGGALEVMTKGGKLKSLGHLNGLPETSGMNLNKVYPLAAKFPVMVSITTSPNTSIADIEELNKRFNKILSMPSMIEALRININVPHGGTVKESNEFINDFRSAVSKANNGTTK